MSDSTITFVILGAVVVLFVWDHLPVEIVAVGAALTLYATGVLDLSQAIAGFGDQTVIFIATLFVVSAALDSTGVTVWAGQRLIDAAGESRSRLLVLMMLLVAALTALISVNGSVAALMPMVVMLAVRLRRPTSQLLLPLAFGAHAGSMLTLTGTPVNVIVNASAKNSGVEPFGFFEFALVGIPLLAGTIAIVVLFGERLLPHRNGDAIPPDLSAHARTLAAEYRLETDPSTLVTRSEGIAEVIVSPRSDLVGATVYPGMVTDSGDFIVLAVQRRGEKLDEAAKLAIGDALLLRGTWGALESSLESDPDVLVVDSPELVRRQGVPLGTGAKRAIAVLAGMVLLLATGAVEPVVAGLLAAGAIVLFGVLDMDQAYRAVSWTTVVLVAGMIPLSTAMTQTGAAAKLADLLVDVVGDHGSHALLLGLFVLTAVLGQLISNMATALIMIPVALSAAAETDVSPRPVLMSLTVAAAAAFLTPVATPANLMVMRPGGYRFGDYWKLGLPLLVLFGLVSVLLVPVIWRF
jgi:di/tricarboxylate transporter